MKILSETASQPVVLQAEPPSLVELSDAELAARYAAGDEAAFWELYSRHADNLLARLRAVYLSNADDIVQETWIKAFQKLRVGKVVITNFGGWLLTIAIHLGCDQFRRKHSVNLEPGMDPPSEELTWIQRKMETESHSARMLAVSECMKRLREQKVDQAKAFDAALAFEELLGVEIAEKLGISRSVFDQRKHRAKEALAECVERKLK